MNILLNCVNVLIADFDMKRPEVDEYYLSLALITSLRSTCARRRVGCILVDVHNRVLSTGYNGVPKGMPHCIDTPCAGVNHKSGTNLDLCEASHAEISALMNCSEIQDIATVYCTTAPCISCTKALLNTSATKIVFISDYDSSGKLLWKKAGRVWNKIII
jgi:dCMP deaminase